MRAEDILKQLDEYIDNGDFPTLDNANFGWADTRLSVFRSNEYWVLFFEFVGCDITWTTCGVYLWAFGNCLTKQGLLPEYTRSIFAIPQDMKVEKEGYPIGYGKRKRISVFINGQYYDFSLKEIHHVVRITFDENAYITNEYPPVQLLQLIRFLCYRLNHPFFASEDFLRFIIDKLSSKPIEDFCFISHKMILFFQTLTWEHPLTINMKVSNIKFFQILAQAIEEGDNSKLLQIDSSTFNTDWRKWGDEYRLWW